MNVLFPSAIMYGMSSKEFWEDDPALYWSYRAFYLKQMEYNQLEADYKCWLNGYYTYEALVTMVGNMFEKDESKKPLYPSKPLTVRSKETNQNKKVDKNEYQQKQFNAWARF